MDGFSSEPACSPALNAAYRLAGFVQCVPPGWLPRLISTTTSVITVSGIDETHHGRREQPQCIVLLGGQDR